MEDLFELFSLENVGQALIFVAAVVTAGYVVYQKLLKPTLAAMMRDVIRSELAPIKNEVETDHGKSLKDAVLRIEKRFEDHIEYHAGDHGAPWGHRE